jgi:hypothetical protein
MVKTRMTRRSLLLVLVGMLLATIAVHADMKANSAVDAWDVTKQAYEHSNVTVYWDGTWVSFVHQIDTFDADLYYPASCGGGSTIYAGLMEFGLAHEDNNPLGAPGFQNSRNWRLVNCDRDNDGDYDGADKSAFPPQGFELIEELVPVTQDVERTCSQNTCQLEIVTTLEVVLDKDCAGGIDAIYPPLVCFYAEGETPFEKPITWKGNPQGRVTAGGGDQTVNFSPQAVTAVDLASFTAEPQGRAVLLAWETASEVDNLGFHLYRAMSPEGPRTQLDDRLIPGQMPGSPAGAAYTFLDQTAVPGLTYYYWLEDVDVYGVGTLHGPVSVQAQVLRRLLPGRPRPAPISVFRR